MALKRLKTINGYQALHRWLAEVSEDPVCWLAREQVKEIPSPYAYSPTKAVYEWNGKRVIWFETRHKHYEVFEVPANLLTFSTDDKACEWHIRFCKPLHTVAAK